MSRGLLHQGQIPIGLGTHGFRAPEQAHLAIQSFDLRTDLWGVGATVWSMYTGIDLNKRFDVLRRAADGNIFGLQRLSDVHLACPPQLEEVIMGLLFIDPSRRPGGAAEVLTQIDAIAAGYPNEATYGDFDGGLEIHDRKIRELLDAIVDPLWSSICRTPGFERYFARFDDGAVVSSPEIRPHHCFLLLRGRIVVQDGDHTLDVEEPEGGLLGAISALTGAARRLTLRADGEVWGCIFNEAELEQLVTCNASVAVRMIRSMATRIASGPPRHRD
jgi:CRP-like cAMP-binding protein